MATECATVIDGVNTLQHSLHVTNEWGVYFGDVKVVIGDLLLSTSISTSPGLTLSAAKLQNITGSIKVFGDRASSTRGEYYQAVIFDFTALRSLSSFQLDSLDDHDNMDVHFSSHITTSVRITDTLDFNLRFLDPITHLSDFYFLRNTLPNQDDGSGMGNIILPFKQVSGHLELSGNPGLFRVSIPHLESAGTMTLSNNTDLHVFNCSMPRLRTISVDSNPTARLSLTQLQSLGGSSTFSNLAFLDLASLHNTTEPGTDLAFSNNTFTELHLPALDALATGLAIKDNPLLNDVDLARLHHVDGSLAVEGNPQLLTFTANRLTVVKGSVKLMGAFTNVEMFRLEEVAGDFELAGDPSMDCSWFDERFREMVIRGRFRGQYSCTGNHTPAAVALRPSTYSDDPFAIEDDEGLSKGAKAGIGAGGAVGGILAVGFSVWALLGWRRKRVAEGQSTEAENGGPEVDGTGRADPPGHELDTAAVPKPVAHQLDTSPPPRPRTPELGDTGVAVELA